MKYITRTGKVVLKYFWDRDTVSHHISGVPIRGKKVREYKLRFENKSEVVVSQSKYESVSIGQTTDYIIEELEWFDHLYCFLIALVFLSTIIGIATLVYLNFS